MLELDVAIELTVPDNTAFTVLTALHDLGYEALKRVERSERLLMRLDRPEAEAGAIAEALQHAEVIFNPNKHRMRYVVTGAKAPALQAPAPQWEAVVFDRDDDTSGLIRLLREHFGIKGLTSLERATAWRLYENGQGASAERLDWACKELLANPYSQRYEIRVRGSLGAAVN